VVQHLPHGRRVAYVLEIDHAPIIRPGARGGRSKSETDILEVFYINLSRRGDNIRRDNDKDDRQEKSEVGVG
jgi:hypothetical protein